MKKAINIFLAIVCIVGFVGCSNKKDDKTTAPQQNQSTEQSQGSNKGDNSNKSQEGTSKDAGANNTTTNSNNSKETSKSSSASNNSTEKLLTQGFGEISSIQVLYKGSNQTYTIDKDKDFIKNVYDCISSTKVAVNNGSQESHVLFTINIVYKSGEKNVIQSTETGEFIYRVLDNKTSWIGGSNPTLAEAINIK